MPNVLTAEVLRNLGIPTEKFNESFEAMMRAGKERLTTLQRPSGGWGWFDHDAEDPFMTACAVQGLSECDRLGSNVDAIVLKRGRARLLEMVKAEKDLNRLAFAAYVLGGEFERLLEKADSLSPYSQALLVLGLHKAKRPEAAAIAEKLAARVKADHWETPNWYYKWDNVSIETTAYAIRALAAVDPDHPLIPKAVDWLLAQRQGNRWRSTKDTAVAIVTLLKVTDLGRIAGAVEVKNDGARKPANLKRIGVRLGAGLPQEILLDLNNPTADKFEAHFSRILAGPQTLIFEKLEDGSDFEFDVEVSQRILGGNPVEESRGLYVTVEYDRPLGSLKRGDEVTATVTVKAWSPVDYVMVLSPIPAGCEVIRGSGTGGFARFEDRYEKAIFFLRSLDGKTRRFTYRMRANFAGRYTVLPARGSLMYNDAIYGTTSLGSASIAP